MRIGNVYRPGVHTCAVEDVLAAAARRMRQADIGALAVLDNGKLVGIITERDLVSALAVEKDPRSAVVRRYMTHNVMTATEDEDSADAAHRMLDAGIRHLPVTRGGQVIGMVSVRDLLALEAWG